MFKNCTDWVTVDAKRLFGSQAPKALKVSWRRFNDYPVAGSRDHEISKRKASYQVRLGKKI